MTAVASPAAPLVADRSGFVFSENGNYAVCLRTHGAETTVESWTLISEVARCQPISDASLASVIRMLPLDDGRVLLINKRCENNSHHCELVLLQPVNGSYELQRLSAVPVALDGHLLPSPNADQLGFLVTVDGSEQSTIWRIPASVGPVEPMMQVPGSLAGGMWFDREVLVLGTNQTFGGSTSSGITIDLPQRSWKRIWSVSDTSTDQIVLYSPRSSLVIVSTNVSGQHRLGWAVLGDPTVQFPEILHRAGYSRQALALDDRGERLLVHEVAGATSRLLVHTPADDRLDDIAGPPGMISPPASWVGDLLRFRLSTPCHPPTLGTVRLATPARWSASRDHELGSQVGDPKAELTELAGPAGPMEAIVYGGPDWRVAKHLVVALHGGPLSAWRFRFEPLFRCLSAAGVAVVAPNYRGSTGYGDEHLRAVIGNWGGPDLDDVLHLGRTLERDRQSRQLSRPVVLGLSYGAFLALLAACHEPQLWSACVAIAPFLSGERFHENAGVLVRRRIAELGGLRRIVDAMGHRDVLSACAALSAPLLIMHGVDDQTIPVEQSRTLRRRLLELGRTEQVDFEYAEIDTDHAGMVLAQRADLNQRVARFCLTQSALDGNQRIGSLSGRRWTEPLPTVLGSGTS